LCYQTTKPRDASTDREAERLDDPAAPIASTPCWPLAPWLVDLIVTGEVPE
jgi:hypothetical protein